MKVHTRYQVLEPDTISGNRVQVVTTYSSFDEREIDMMVDRFKDEIGAGIIVDVNVEKEEQ